MKKEGVHHNRKSVYESLEVYYGNPLKLYGNPWK